VTLPVAPTGTLCVCVCVCMCVYVCVCLSMRGASTFGCRYFGLCFDLLSPDHGLSEDEKRQQLLEEWRVDSDGLPVMTGLNFAKAVFELLGTTWQWHRAVIGCCPPGRLCCMMAMP